MPLKAPAELTAREPIGEPRPTRHRPQKFSCTDSDGHLQYCMVKLCQSQPSAVACISEMVCTLLLQAGGAQISTLTPVRVRVSDPVYEQATQHTERPAPNVGVHFGTMWRDDVEDGPITISHENIQWHQILYLYVYDVWLKNIDRAQFGNVLVTRLTQKLLKVIASDQSDCFGGVATFSAGRDAVARATVSAEIPVIDDLGKAVGLERVLALIPEPFSKLIDSPIMDCKKMAQEAPSALRQVADGWTEIAGFDPSFIAGWMIERADNLRTTLRPDLYDPDEEYLKGGILLGAPSREEEE